MTIAAGIVGNMAMTAVLTGRHVTAKHRRAATLNRRHHLQLVEAQMARIVLSPSMPVGTENIRDLQVLSGHPFRPVVALDAPKGF